MTGHRTWRRALAVASLLAVVYLSATGGLLWWSTVPVVAGWQPTVVLTGSMAPALDPGDVVLIGPATASPGTLPRGRVALVADPSRDTGTYLHRVARYEPDGGVVTRGDANADEDPAVAADHVLGQVRLVVPLVGTPAVWMRNGDLLPLAGLVLATWAAVLGASQSGRWAAQGAARVRARHRARRPSRARVARAATAAVIALGTVAGAALATGVVAPWSGTTSAAGSSFATGQWAAGNLQWWGSGGAGQGGVLAVTATWTPTAVTTAGGAPTTWREVSSGAGHTCAIADDAAVAGTLWCWGSNTSGQLGTGGASTAQPTQVSGGGTWLAVDAGLTHTCGVRTGGVAWCWGGNTRGQLGSGNYVSSTVPVRAGATLTGLTGIATGDEHTCATAPTTVWCWGARNDSNWNEPQPVDMNLAGSWTGITAGGAHTCTVRSDQSLWCWGRNSSGQLGRGTTTFESSPGSEPVATGVTSAAAGATHTCLTTTGGRLQCTGSNIDGQLASGTLAGSTTFQPAGAATTWTSVAGRGGLGATACGLQGSTLWCWGSNGHGQVANGQADLTRSPVQVAGTWATASAGRDHMCALSTAGTLACAGSNATGQLGTSAPGDDALSPTEVGTADWASVDVGEAFACGARVDGSLWCWGSNTWGQLGRGDTVPQERPARVGALTTWSTVAVGRGHACALRDDETLWCWGDNGSGQLGLGDATARSAPTQVGTGVWTAVTTGTRHTCATASDGQLWCWGANEAGQLGVGDTTGRSVPTAVAHPATWRSVDAGAFFTCGVRVTGTLWCWGENTDFQIGDFTTTNRPSPTQVGGDTVWGSVAAGARHVCALRSDASVRCWGSGDDGRLGLGTTELAKSPTAVNLGGANTAALALGARHTCVRLTSSSVRCWGDGSEGQLGTGSTTDALSPVAVPSSSGTTLLAAGGATTLRLSTLAPPESGEYLAAVTADQPLSYWRLDENDGTVASATLGAPAGTYLGSPVLNEPGAVPGQTGTSAHLDGLDDQVTFGDVHDFANNAPFSVELWVRPSVTGSGFARLVTKEQYSSATDRVGWGVLLPGSGSGAEGSVLFERYGGATATSILTEPTLTAGTWYHVVATYDGSTMRLYLDGALTVSAESLLSLGNNSRDLRIGSMGVTDFHTGGIDEVAVYGSALSAERVLAHYTAARP